MIKHNFKIGDKVRIVSYPNLSKVGQIATIRAIYSPSNKFQYCITIGDVWTSSVHEIEVEAVVKVGEQLLFSFMTP